VYGGFCDNGSNMLAVDDSDKWNFNVTVCAKTVWTALDISSDVNLCYAEHFQATQDIVKKKDNKQNLFSKT